MTHNLPVKFKEGEKYKILKTKDNLYSIVQYEIDEIGMMQFINKVQIWKNGPTPNLIFDSTPTLFALTDFEDELDYNNKLHQFSLYAFRYHPNKTDQNGNSIREFYNCSFDLKNKKFKLNTLNQEPLNKNWEPLDNFTLGKN